MKIGPVQRQSLIALLSLLGVTAVGYVSTIYFAHALGPGILGSFFLFLAYYGVFDLVCDGGFGGAAVKRITEGKDPGSYFSLYIVLRLILLVLVVLLIFILSPFLVDLQNSNLVPLLIVTLVIGTGGSIIAAGISATAKIGVLQVSVFLNNVVKIVVQIIAVFLGYAAAGLVGGFIAGLVAGAIVNFRFLILPLSKFSMSHFRSLFSFSFWSFLASSGSLIYTYSDTIMIGYFLTNSDVGIYRVSFQLSTISAFIALSLQPVLFPRISAWHTSMDFGKISDAISRALTYSLFLAIPVTVGGFVLSDRLLYFFYGADFESGTFAFTVLLLVQIANVFMYIETMSLGAVNRPKIGFYITGASAGLNVVLNYTLIPILGISGAAIATFFSMGLNAGLAYYFLNQVVPVRFERRPLLNIVSASAVMGIAVLVFRILVPITHVAYLILAIAIGAALYFLLFLRLERSIRDELRDILLTIGIPWPSFI